MLAPKREQASKMRKVVAFSALFLAVVITACPALAIDKCPINDAAIMQAGGYALAAEAAVKAASGCEGSYKMLSACQIGSSGDVALAGIVRARCEPLFMGKANRGMKAAYRKKLTGCARIAKRHEGTMYLGLAAVCEARAARNFARKYAKSSRAAH
jgi:hypothetical protein